MTIEYIRTRTAETVEIEEGSDFCNLDEINQAITFLDNLERRLNQNSQLSNTSEGQNALTQALNGVESAILGLMMVNQVVSEITYEKKAKGKKAKENLDDEEEQF
ncbi:hypothetical protein [Microcoleus sp. Pol10D4]|uniref:hypothetical protein n=1 Tax=Microcoleus sp. Pol10D4 TaxID=3055387 RepID=UPI002FD78C1B